MMMKCEHVLQGGPLDGRSFRYGGESECIGYRGGVYRRTAVETRTGCVWVWCVQREAVSEVMAEGGVKDF